MWDFSNDRPIYLQLKEEFEQLIFNGTYKSGDKVPSVRELAFEASVNPNTVQKAFGELERVGLICVQRTSGRFITEDEELIKRLRDDLAIMQINAFLAKMKDLGFERDEIISLINKKDTAEVDSKEDK